MKYSVIIPVYNEEKNLLLLYEKLSAAMNALSGSHEIIFIDDGSNDSSRDIIKKLSLNDKSVKAIIFQKNFGQTAALTAGFKEALGEIIITLDADLQNDPLDIPRLAEKINQGYDVVCGWRQNRKDNLFLRKIPSWFANILISKITKMKLHDYGCTLKAYRKEIIGEIKLYGEMHRFIPAYAAANGAKILEVAVNHKPRQYGKSHYGLSRTFKVILDLITTIFLTKYLNKPIHFFGGIGLVTFLLGLLSGLAAVTFKLAGIRDFVETPLPLVTIFLIMVSLQFISIGIIAEMIMRTYYETQNKTQYHIKEKINF